MTVAQGPPVCTSSIVTPVIPAPVPVSLQFDGDGGAASASASPPVASITNVTGASRVSRPASTTTAFWPDAVASVRLSPCSSNVTSYTPGSSSCDVLGLVLHDSDAATPDSVARFRSCRNTVLAPTWSHWTG